MKSFFLLLGIALLILSCKKTETQDSNSLNDSLLSSDTVSDTILPATPTDTMTAVPDSVNHNNMNNRKVDSLNR